MTEMGKGLKAGGLIICMKTAASATEDGDTAETVFIEQGTVAVKQPSLVSLVLVIKGIEHEAPNE